MSDLIIHKSNNFNWEATGDRSLTELVYEEAPLLNRGRWYQTIYRGSMASMGAGEYELTLEDYDEYITINKDELIYLDYKIDGDLISDNDWEDSIDNLRFSVINASSPAKEQLFLTAVNDYSEDSGGYGSRINRQKWFYYKEMFENGVISDDDEFLTLTYFSYSNPTEGMEIMKTDNDFEGYDTLEDFLESFGENLGDLKVIDENTIELGYDYTAGYETFTLTRQ